METEFNKPIEKRCRRKHEANVQTGPDFLVLIDQHHVSARCNQQSNNMVESDGQTSLYFILFAALLVIVFLLSKKLHESAKLSVYLSEASLTLLLGMVAGCIVHYLIADLGISDEQTEAYNDEDNEYGTFPENYALALKLLDFDPHIFFYALLPPIMFNSGFELRRELFYRHIKPIVMFACAGTTISCLTTGFVLYGAQTLGLTGDFAPTLMELLTFGALIAATDAVSVLAVLQKRRVDPHLFSLVFGESALNDAVALVLFDTFSHFVVYQYDDRGSLTQRSLMFTLHFFMTAIFSPLLGVAMGVAVALLYKQFDLRAQPKMELGMYAMLIYVPFLIAEEMELSGIVAIFFTGMSARRYVTPNVSKETHQNAASLFELFAYVAETVIFLELGLSVFGLNGSFEWAFTACAFVAALLGRAISIYPLAYAYNFSLRQLVDDEVVAPSTLPVLFDQQSTDNGSVSSSNSSPTRRRRRRKTPLKRKDQKISVNMTHILWFAGLRGAVAYACARDFPNIYGHNDEVTAATVVIVLVTIVIMGGMTDSLLKTLEIDVDVDEDKYMENWHKERQLTGAFHRFGTFVHRCSHSPFPHAHFNFPRGGVYL